MSDAQCSSETKNGRLVKAEQFMLAAETVAMVMDEHEVADAYVTLCVHAGIAAADVICCAKLGRHHQGENHGEAVALLAQANQQASRHLQRLLSMKTRSGYSARLTSDADQKRARRAAVSLLAAAQVA